MVHEVLPSGDDLALQLLPMVRVRLFYQIPHGGGVNVLPEEIGRRREPQRLRRGLDCHVMEPGLSQQPVEHPRVVERADGTHEVAKVGSDVLGQGLRQDLEYGGYRPWHVDGDATAG